MNVFVIGNGYSINFIKILEKLEYLEKDAVDLINLFSAGDRIPDNTKTNSYLSKNNFPQLWQLGVRSIINSDCASKIINNIISSYTLYVNRCISRKDRVDRYHPCVTTYFELNRYLKSLILYYDELVLKAINQLTPSKNIEEICKIFPLLDEIAEDDIIISYNYDIWLERLLSLCQKKYFYAGIEPSKKSYIKIFKPHGSVNFELYNSIDDETNIYDVLPKEIEIIEGNDKSISLSFKHALIIPPSGFIIGKKASWVSEIREGLKNTLHSCPSRVTFYGLSYDIVDRDEINEIICQLDIKETQLVYVNPKPSSSLDYILSQHFEHYYHRKP